MTARDYRAPNPFDRSSLLSDATLDTIRDASDVELQRIVDHKPLTLLTEAELEFVSRCTITLAARNVRRARRQSATTQPKMMAVRP
jgi:hypothetical protein